MGKLQKWKSGALAGNNDYTLYKSIINDADVSKNRVKTTMELGKLAQDNKLGKSDVNYQVILDKPIYDASSKKENGMEYTIADFPVNKPQFDLPKQDKFLRAVIGKNVQDVEAGSVASSVPGYKEISYKFNDDKIKDMSQTYANAALLTDEALNYYSGMIDPATKVIDADYQNIADAYKEIDPSGIVDTPQKAAMADAYLKLKNLTKVERVTDKEWDNKHRPSRGGRGGGGTTPRIYDVYKILNDAFDNVGITTGAVALDALPIDATVKNQIKDVVGKGGMKALLPFLSADDISISRDPATNKLVIESSGKKSPIDEILFNQAFNKGTRAASEVIKLAESKKKKEKKSKTKKGIFD